ncbi:MAG: hypothetical protein LQ338_002312 [Usnochroma carphineum]|nr:MAG: hypothetical protein LQ338_002312 [Usnochroma carphineum]
MATQYKTHGKPTLSHPTPNLDGLIEALLKEKRESEPFPLINLPRELRDRVYKFVMATPEYISPCSLYSTLLYGFLFCVTVIDETTTKNNASSQFHGEFSDESAVQQLFAVSKQVCQESIEVYYGSNTFYLMTQTLSSPFSPILTRAYCI